MNRPFPLLSRLSALALCLSACGGAEKAPVAAASDPVQNPKYAAECKAQADQRDKDVAAKKYIPVELLVHLWPGRDATSGARSYLPESELASALRSPVAAGQQRLRTFLVLARGGTGKTKLAESLTAQACGQAPVFRIDLNMDVAAALGKAPAGQNVIAAHVVRTLGLPAPQGPEQALQAYLGARPWVAVLDSLDEVPLLQREEVVRQVDDLVTRVGPNGRAVVMTRPPVFSSNYGLQTVDARLEIPPLTCDETDAALQRNVPDPKDHATLRDFVQRYGLNRKVSSFERCYYPHMSTYRDLQVVQRLARNAAISAESPDFKGFQNSRAQVYTYFVTAQLLKDLQGLALTPADALAVVDRMVAAKNPGKGERNLPFTQPDCVAVAQGDDVSAKQAACERLLQSSLFKVGHEAGIFHFDNQSLGDLFLSRWTAGSLVKDGRVDCRLVAEKAHLLESNEVAGFLVGQPSGQACLSEVAVELCKRGGYAQHIYEQMDQGLPSGPERARLLAEVSKDLQDLPQNDLCVSGLLEQLGKGVEPVALPAEPTPAAAPAKPAKGKKGKK